MGQEIETTRFTHQDFAEFEARLRGETELLDQWFQEERFSRDCCVGGFELEACLVDDRCLPAPINQAFLERLDSPLVVPELAAFNVELNNEPRRLEGDALSRMENELRQTWAEADAVARQFGAGLLMIGILPTLSGDYLSLANMSRMKRYRALNEQVLRLREGRPIELNIYGRDPLQAQHSDVMLESAATSFQIHLKVNQAEGPRFYNASKIIAAPMVAVAANSPYLFGHDLWDETRVPLFQQAVAVGTSDYRSRVTFGMGYIQASLMECFQENPHRYPVLLPMTMDEPPDRLSHLRLHNGTIWRWNRPLIGFDQDGTPHLRIEHRVIPAGPSIVDSTANLALYYGLVHVLARRDPAPESRLPFAVAHDNFYAAARNGLRAEIVWTDGRPVKLRELVLEELLPVARKGLTRLDMERADIEGYLGVIEARVRSGQNGAAWQRAYVAKHGADMQELCGAYRERQASDAPICQWSL